MTRILCKPSTNGIIFRSDDVKFNPNDHLVAICINDIPGIWCVCIYIIYIYILMIINYSGQININS